MNSLSPNQGMIKYQAINFVAKAHLLHATSKNSSNNIDLTIEQLISNKEGLLQCIFGAESLCTLAGCYLVKFRQSLAIEYALCALDILNEVLDKVTTSHYKRFQSLIDAAELYMESSTPYQNIEIALEHFENALENTHRDVHSKICSAQFIISKLEIEQPDIFTTKSSVLLKLLNIIGSAVLLLPHIAFFGIYAYSHLQSLQTGQNIVLIGASHTLNLLMPQKALEILEMGQAIFWTHILCLRSPFDEIPKVLRGRLIWLAQRLEKVPDAFKDSTDQQYIEWEIAQRRKESNEFNLLIEQVHSLPGLEHFMLPDEYSIFVKAAEKGPIIVLVCSMLTCYAIVLKPSRKAVSIFLDSITYK
jgi:hypothetical protein